MKRKPTSAPCVRQCACALAERQSTADNRSVARNQSVRSILTPLSAPIRCLSIWLYACMLVRLCADSIGSRTRTRFAAEHCALFGGSAQTFARPAHKVRRRIVRCQFMHDSSRIWLWQSNIIWVHNNTSKAAEIYGRCLRDAL